MKEDEIINVPSLGILKITSRLSFSCFQVLVLENLESKEELVLKWRNYRDEIDRDTLGHEANLLKKLEKCPGVIKLLWYGNIQDDPGNTYYESLILSPLGITLSEYFKRLPKKSHLPTIMKIISELLVTFQQLQRANILHCDVKPSNIIVKDNSPILIDFGYSLDDYKRRSTEHLGTIPWMAYDHIIGEKTRARSDLQSLFYTSISVHGVELTWEVDPPTTNKEWGRLENKMGKLIKNPEELLCKSLPKIFSEFCNYVHTTTKVPSYSSWVAKFREASLMYDEPTK
jgi:serine/threonine protein kinase